MSQQRDRKKIAIFLIILILIAGLLFVVWPGNISAEQAMEIAINHIGGADANWPHMVFENFQRAWYVEVFYGDGVYHIYSIYGVYVNRNSGQVIRAEAYGAIWIDIDSLLDMFGD
ncbi:MAG: PepSY domain-containing protein [Defluviitaleaceae bacterium]|nr:PepSY domain-containing protein [Defluviitaleaceae bacterium]